MCYPTTFPSWAFVREKLNAEEEELRERGEIEGHVGSLRRKKRGRTGQAIGMKRGGATVHENPGSRR